MAPQISQRRSRARENGSVPRVEVKKNKTKKLKKKTKKKEKEEEEKKRKRKRRRKRRRKMRPSQRRRILVSFLEKVKNKKRKNILFFYNFFK